MKKTVKILCLALIAAAMLACLGGCAEKKPSGSYTRGREIAGLGGYWTYTFEDEDKVTVTATIVKNGKNTDTSYVGSYEITETDEGKKQIIFTFGDEDAYTYNGTHSFVIGEDDDGKYIKIDGTRYDKK